MARTASGMVRTNAEPHQKRVSSRPTASGPIAEAPPPMPDQRAIALVRRRPPNRAVISESVVGNARRQRRRRDRQGQAYQEHELAAVAVGQGAEVEHRRGQAERETDGHRVEQSLRGVPSSRFPGSRARRRLPAATPWLLPAAAAAGDRRKGTPA
jgi:hypothetical protein